MIPRSNDFELEIVRPTKTELLTVAWVEVEGLGGSFTVGPEHSPLVTVLKPGSQISYSSLEGQITHTEVTSGIFSIGTGRAVIILDD